MRLKPADWMEQLSDKGLASVWCSLERLWDDLGADGAAGSGLGADGAWLAHL